MLFQNCPSCQHKKLSFIHQEWLAFNFSLQYHLWIKHWCPENSRNDHKLKSFWFIDKFSLSAPWEVYREYYREYAYWCVRRLCKNSKGEQNRAVLVLLLLVEAQLTLQPVITARLRNPLTKECIFVKERRQ